MRSDDRTVDYQVLHVRFFEEMLVHSLPDAPLAPSGETFVDGVPLAVLGWKQSPLCACASDPQDCFDEQLASVLVTDVYMSTLPKECENLRPLF